MSDQLLKLCLKFVACQKFELKLKNFVRLIRILLNCRLTNSFYLLVVWSILVFKTYHVSRPEVRKMVAIFETPSVQL